MFKCDACQKSSGPRKSPIRRTVKTREVAYTNKGRTSYGVETVKEIQLCEDCNSGN